MAEITDETLAAALMLADVRAAEEIMLALDVAAFVEPGPRSVAEAVASCLAVGVDPTMGAIIDTGKIEPGDALDIRADYTSGIAAASMIRRIRSAWHDRAARDLLADAHRRIAAGLLTADRVEAFVARGLAGLTVEQKTQPTADAAMASVADEIAAGVKPVATWPGLDDIAGGLVPGRVWIVSGKTGGGKSAFIVDLCCRVAPGMRPLIASFEMSQPEVAVRIAARVLGLPVSLPRPNSTRRIREMVVQRLREAEKSPIARAVTVRDDMTTVEDVALALRRGEYGLLVVDYLQLVAAVGRHSTREQAVASVSRTCKRLAVSLAVPVVVLSQLNRDGQARESDGIQHDADVIIDLEQEQPDEEGARSVDRIIRVRKNRSGATGYVKMRYEKHLHRFEELAPAPTPIETEDDSWL